MSTPRSLALPAGVRPCQITTPVGVFAALEALPRSGVSERLPALLVPGHTGSKEDFLAVLEPLARAGRRVVAIDMRGQYETPGPEDAAAYTCAALGRDVAAVAAAVGAGEPVHLVGHSFGGLVAREAALCGTADLASCTLMSSGPAGIVGPRAHEGRLLLRELAEQGLETGLETLWTTRLEPEALAAGVPDDILAFLHKRLFANSPTGLVAMGEQALTAPDRVDELAALPLPFLVLYGEHDDGWPPRLQAEMADRLGAECVVVPGACHSPAVEAPETTSAALSRFWNDVERTRFRQERLAGAS